MKYVSAVGNHQVSAHCQWLEMLYSDSVCIDDKTGHYSKMYRGKQSLESLIATFDGLTCDDIKRRIRCAK